MYPPSIMNWTFRPTYGGTWKEKAENEPENVLSEDSP
jgi:hypothetical protein